MGMNVKWVVGDREPVGNIDKKGNFVPRLGKGGGVIYKQTVEKVFVPTA